MMKFEVVGQVTDVEIIAVGSGIRLKGVAVVRLPNGALRTVELHWYEAHGIGKRDLKIKRYLDVQ